MQLSELFRRGIVLPLDDHAEAQMRSWDVQSALRVAYVPIIGDDEFHRGLDLFRRINETCGTQIDDYEEEILEPAQAAAARQALAGFRAAQPQPCQPITFSLIEMLRDAENQGRPLFFVL